METTGNLNANAPWEAGRGDGGQDVTDVQAIYITDPPKTQAPILSDRHLTMLLEESALTPEVIQARGYYTASGEKGSDGYSLGYKDLEEKGFSAKQILLSALVLPIHPPDGSNGHYMIRPDAPRSYDRKDKHLPDGTFEQEVHKYEQPKGAHNRLDCNPICRTQLEDPAIPLYITEGIKKGDSLAAHGLCAISLPGGVYGWMGLNAHGASTVTPDLKYIAWKTKDGQGRRVHIVFDSDVAQKVPVKTATKRLAQTLRNLGAAVTVVVLPGGPDGHKVGVDDFFAQGGTVAQLEQLANTSDLVSVTLRGDAQPTMKTADYYAAFAKLDHDFRLNIMSDHIEVNGQPITDALAARIRCELRDAGIQTVHIAEDAWTARALDQQYHPVKDYLEGLTWDGGNHIERLCNWFTDAHPDPDRPDDPCPVFRAYLRRWLIGAVGKVLQNTQNAMLVLDGPQNIGKSYFVRWLGSGLPGYFVESAIHPDDKDHKLMLASKFIWECQELASTTRRQDVDSLKSFLTTVEVTERAPYGHYDQILPAMASFIGTVNNLSGFLTDRTGTRRFNACTLRKIDWLYSTWVDVDQVWAEAAHACQAGETGYLTEAEAGLRDRLNRDYEVDSGLVDWILKFYTVSRAADDFVPTRAIAAKLQDGGFRGKSTDSLQREIGIELTRLGLTRGQRTIDGQRPQGYYGLVARLFAETNAD